jgi:hypothetical protein
MRYKTFLATFLLFLTILFSSLGVVSIYMTRNQIKMLKEKSLAEYQSIVNSITKDMAVLTEREEKDKNFVKDMDALVNGYMRYYERYHVTIGLITEENDVSK